MGERTHTTAPASFDGEPVKDDGETRRQGDGEKESAQSPSRPVAKSSSPAPPPAQTEPSTTEEETPESSGQSAPDFAVSATRFRLIKAERIEADDEDSEKSANATPEHDDNAWVWNGKEWSVTESPGSTRTRKFVLLLKGTDGKYHYARSCSLNIEEFNRRFAGRHGVADRRLKPVRKSDYDKFKTFVFEAWRSQAVRTDPARLGPAARLV